jgi:hypothetical protein
MEKKQNLFCYWLENVNTQKRRRQTIGEKYNDNQNLGVKTLVK